MSAIPWLVFLVALIITVNANTEKLIFLGPSAITIPDVHPGLDDLRLDPLSPTGQHTLETQLSVKFPTEEEPRGVQSWYLIEGLQEGRRYELRICWVATVSMIIICLSVIPCELPPTLPNCLCLFNSCRSLANQPKQPTKFWLDVHQITEVFEAPLLVSSLAAYSERRQDLGLEDREYTE